MFQNRILLNLKKKDKNQYYNRLINDFDIFSSLKGKKAGSS